VREIYPIVSGWRNYTGTVGSSEEINYFSLRDVYWRCEISVNSSLQKGTKNMVDRFHPTLQLIVPAHRVGMREYVPLLHTQSRVTETYYLYSVSKEYRIS
jgi:hypothetical protein